MALASRGKASPKPLNPSTNPDPARSMVINPESRHRSPAINPAGGFHTPSDQSFRPPKPVKRGILIATPQRLQPIKGAWRPGAPKGPGARIEGLADQIDRPSESQSSFWETTGLPLGKHRDPRGTLSNLGLEWVFQSVPTQPSQPLNPGAEGKDQPASAKWRCMATWKALPSQG
jgi:hypothetical protein